MPDDLTDQLRRYGAALEEHLDAPTPAVVDLSTRRRFRLLVPAAAVVVVALVAATLVLSGGDDDAVTVPVSTEEEHETTTTSSTATTTGDASSPTTVADEGRSTTDPTPSPTSTSVMTTTTASAPTTTATTSPAATGGARITGTATWIGSDPRATLAVAACPSTDTGVGCWSMVTTSVADDGSFVLHLPDDPPEWRVAAFITLGLACVFNCSWAQAPSTVRSEAVTVDAHTQPSVDLTIAARVVDVLVRDRNGDPFEGGGVQATDTRCTPPPDNRCPNDATPMFSGAPDGAVRLVLHPDVTYAFHGQAVDQEWPDPMWHHEGHEFWFSPDETMTGAALDEGHVFYVDGAPSESP